MINFVSCNRLEHSPCSRGTQKTFILLMIKTMFMQFSRGVMLHHWNSRVKNLTSKYLIICHSHQGHHCSTCTVPFEPTMFGGRERGMTQTTSSPQSSTEML